MAIMDAQKIQEAVVRLFKDKTVTRLEALFPTPKPRDSLQVRLDKLANVFSYKFQFRYLDHDE
jgi:hypothetical protein